MGTAWTKEQEQVIWLRDCNILVSAAAGSGKTAVLVERIISMITDPVHPLDIDRLLVVTFTRAAAGEMKDRIGAAIEKKLGEDEHNEHLQRQSALVHHAQITTIDSFCSYVIRNYFHMIDLDPGYRMGEDGEIKLLQAETADEVIETAYQKDTEEFRDFVESYSTGKTDEGIKELILRLYTFSISYPWPNEWLLSCKAAYQADTAEELENTDWMIKLKTEVKQNIGEALEFAGQAIAIAEEEDGLYMYLPVLEEDEKRLQQLTKAENFQQMQQQLEEVTFARLSSKKDETVSEEAKEAVKYLREQEKSILKDLQEQYFSQNLQEVLENMKKAEKPISVLIDLVLKFSEEFAAKKREKNILDFSDLEHFALNILVEHSPEGDRQTAAALELSGRFEEILIDEYQDSNLVQETLLSSVSRLSKDIYNLFMVGDVKQSIYRFRQARPELFMGKFETYQTKEGKCQRIDLHKNFRSRSEILSGVNYIFHQIMGHDLGGVEYDREAALYPGADFPAGEAFQNHSPAVEVLMTETDDENWEEMETGETAIELEARTVAGKIQELTKTGWVLDKDTKTYRKARYQDCVILLRTMARWSDTFSRVLNGQGIPTNVTSKTGYFSAVEVVTVLNYLNICDNPRQDIAFTGVMYSPMGGFTAEELALIKSSHKELSMYECVLAYEQAKAAEISIELQNKTRTFLQTFEKLRLRVSYLPIHQLIQELLDQTGYLSYVEALPAGEQRRGNLEMLVEKAMEYGNTGYRGLFHFLRYMEQMQEYKVDFGEANTVSEHENTVRIMSIHKSKGLEFPIVIAAGMGKAFNQQDARNRLLLHPDLGIGADWVDYHLRTRMPTLVKKVIQKQTVLENLGEELRVLYVALTRAKEKLILSGTISALEKRLRGYQLLLQREDRKLSYVMRTKAGCYWDWILGALARHSCMRPLYEEYQIQWNPLHPLYDAPIDISVHKISPFELVEEEVQVHGNRRLLKEQFLHWDVQAVYDLEMKEEAKKRFTYVYPYEGQRDIPVKVTVSDVKKRSQAGADSYEWYVQPDVIPLIPKFMQKEEQQMTGAARGTAYHRVMECMDFVHCKSPAEAAGQLEELVKQNRISREIAETVKPEDLSQFSCSYLGKRMIQAQKQNTLHKEQPFVLGIPASELRQEWGDEETILVQGIIDVFFYEEDGIVLADYKTDRVPEGNPQLLVDKYGVQLAYYAKALERMTGKKVKEKIIYSFALGEEIFVK